MKRGVRQKESKDGINTGVFVTITNSRSELHKIFYCLKGKVKEMYEKSLKKSWRQRSHRCSMLKIKILCYA